MSRLEYVLQKSVKKASQHPPKDEKDEQEMDALWNTTPPTHSTCSSITSSPCNAQQRRRRRRRCNLSSVSPSKRPCIDSANTECQKKDGSTDKDEMDDMWEASRLVKETNATPPCRRSCPRTSSGIGYSYSFLPPLDEIDRSLERDLTYHPYPASSSSVSDDVTEMDSKVQFKESNHTYTLHDGKKMDTVYILSGSKVVEYLDMRERAGGTQEHVPSLAEIHGKLSMEGKPEKSSYIRSTVVIHPVDILRFRLACIKHVFRYLSSPIPLVPIPKTYMREFWFMYMYTSSKHWSKQKQHQQARAMETLVLRTFTDTTWTRLEEWASQVSGIIKKQENDDEIMPPWNPELYPQEYDTYVNMQRLLFGDDAWPVVATTEEEQQVQEEITSHPLRTDEKWVWVQSWMFPETYLSLTTDSLFRWVYNEKEEDGENAPASYGTRMHRPIDERLKRASLLLSEKIKQQQQEDKAEKRSDVEEQIDAFFEDWGSEQSFPYSELRLGSFRHKICGSLDALYWDEQEKKWMVTDWKFSHVLFGETKLDATRDTQVDLLRNWLVDHPNADFSEPGWGNRYMERIVEPISTHPRRKRVVYVLRSRAIGTSHPIFKYLMQLAVYRKLLVLNGWNDVSHYANLVVFHPLHETYRVIRVNLTLPLSRLPSPMELVEQIFALRKRDLRVAYSL